MRNKFHNYIEMYSAFMQLFSQKDITVFKYYSVALYHKSTVLSEFLQYLHSCRQTFSLFLPVHMLPPDSGTHKMHVEMCLSSARTDIL